MIAPAIPAIPRIAKSLRDSELSFEVIEFFIVSLLSSEYVTLLLRSILKISEDVIELTHKVNLFGKWKGGIEMSPFHLPNKFYPVRYSVSLRSNRPTMMQMMLAMQVTASQMPPMPIQKAVGYKVMSRLS